MNEYENALKKKEIICKGKKNFMIIFGIKFCDREWFTKIIGIKQNEWKKNKKYKEGLKMTQKKSNLDNFTM